MMITQEFGNHKVTYPVRAAEHVKYEYFILDMMIHRDTLLQFIVYLNFRIISYIMCYLNNNIDILPIAGSL